ncbi:uncharacterized protein K441DRAFT_39499 [Cenococcum geophilum 1.58]|uniref:uncharacterized protein n=1 Tax=Cenococcum geophilum 1.58 TaxID=794803 RepID=UPI00358FCE56|nr:hypothetical protein K441DRAFT_39499 [Cenococcum geophilum 1.58]
MAEPKPAMKFSLVLGAKKNAGSKKTTAPTNLKRPISALNDEEEDNAPKIQEVSHFDANAGGAIDVNAQQDKGPLVIPRRPNRDWREESRRKRQRNTLQAGAQQARVNGSSANEEKDAVNGGGIAYGLTVVEKEEQQDEDPTDKGEHNRASSEPAAAETTQPAPKTDDQLALEALLGEKPKSALVLPAVVTEEQAFKRDYDSAPDMATLEEYEAVPVEEFGAAFLRGMGWKDGEQIGRRRAEQTSKPRLLERRPALLGIGAKEEAAVGVELGEWGKGMKGKRKVDQSYNPVLLLNKETGEKLTEEELKARMEQQKLVEQERASERKRRSPARDSDHRSSEKSSRRHRYDDDDDGHRGSDRRTDRKSDKDRSRHYDSRHSSSRKDRSSSTDSRRKRKRQDDYDSNRDDNKRRHRDDRYDRSKREDRDGEKYEDSRRRRRQEVY